MRYKISDEDKINVFFDGAIQDTSDVSIENHYSDLIAFCVFSKRSESIRRFNSKEDVSTRLERCIDEILEFISDSGMSISDYPELHDDYKNLKKLRKTLDSIDSITIDVDGKTRNLYHASVHGDKSLDDLNFIRWDKPLSKNNVEKILNQLKKDEQTITGKVQNVLKSINAVGNFVFNKMDVAFSALTRTETLAETIKRFDPNAFDTPKMTESSLSGKNGQEVYKAISKYCSNDKTASAFLLRAGIDGIQYPIEYQSKGSHDDGFNYVVFDDNAIEIAEHTRFMSTPAGEVYGFATKDSKIYLDPEKMNANTPIHEYGHLWVDMVKRDNEPLYNKMIELAKESDVYENLRINPAYRDLDDIRLAEEAMAFAIGNNGENIFSSKQNADFVQRMKDCLNELWQWVLDRLSANKENTMVHQKTPEQVRNITFGELADDIAKDLLSGKQIGDHSPTPTSNTNKGKLDDIVKVEEVLLSGLNEELDSKLSDVFDNCEKLRTDTAFACHAKLVFSDAVEQYPELTRIFGKKSDNVQCVENDNHVFVASTNPAIGRLCVHCNLERYNDINRDVFLEKYHKTRVLMNKVDLEGLNHYISIPSTYEERIERLWPDYKNVVEKFEFHRKTKAL
jgi:hypothetical protein